MINNATNVHENGFRLSDSGWNFAIPGIPAAEKAMFDAKSFGPRLGLAETIAEIAARIAEMHLQGNGVSRCSKDCRKESRKSGPARKGCSR